MTQKELCPTPTLFVQTTAQSALLILLKLFLVQNVTMEIILKIGIMIRVNAGNLQIDLTQRIFPALPISLIPFGMMGHKLMLLRQAMCATCKACLPRFI